MNEKMNGASNATVILLNRLYATNVVILPPSIPVITGAAVAVGQKTQIKVPSAISGLNG